MYFGPTINVAIVTQTATAVSLFGGEANAVNGALTGQY